MLVALIATLVDWSIVIVAAQDDLGTPAAETTISETPISEPTEVPTEAVTEVPTEVPTEVATEIATAEPTEAPPIFVPETPTAEATESPTATLTSSPTPASTEIGPAADDPQSAIIHIIATIGSSDGPRLIGVCFNVTNPSYGFPEGFGCTDANGEVTIQTASSFTGSKGFNIAITTPTGYEPVDSLLRFLTAGMTNTVSVTLTPLAPVTETLRAIDSSTGNPVAGACWNYYENLNHGTPGSLAIGPKCDDDNDGTVIVTDIPLKAYCVVVTPPAGYTVVGSTTICTEAAQRPTNITKAFSVADVTGNGSVNLTFHAPWGAPVEGVCGQVSLLVSGTPFSVGSACSDSSGHAVITGLLDGSYTLSALTWPNFWEQFPEASFTITGGSTATLDVTVNPRTAGSATLITVFVNGPTRVGGSCWTVANGLDTAAPGYYQVAAPVCDTDGDGTVVLVDVPSGPYCFLLTPPDGYYRSDGQRGFCVNESNGHGFTLTVGVSQIPVTSTTTPTTPTPTPTTPAPTPTPVPNEPNGNIAAINCADDHRTFADGSPNYGLCQSAGPGLRFAVFQNGTQITTITTGADGTAMLTLPERTPYVLQYLDGNTSPYIPAPNQSTMNRYDSNQRFFFTRDPASDHTWTFTATIRGYNDGFNHLTPLRGACANVVGQDDVEYLPEVCDTDGDGVIVVGQLAPRYDSSGNIFYRMVMTQPPTGYETMPLGGYIYDANHPNDVVVSVNYTANILRIHVVDENGDPVLGYCLNGDGNIYGGSLRCDDSGPYNYDDATVDGVIVFGGLVPGVQHTFESYPTSPGWTPDTNVVSFATTADVFTDVTYRVHRYGSTGPNQANVHVKISYEDLGPGYEPIFALGLADICYRISGFVGNPAGGACSSITGEFLFRNVPQGSYSLVLNRNNSICASVPSSVLFTVTAGDLGDTVEVNIEAAGCTARPSGGICYVSRTAPGRTVDLYYGTLTGSGGGSLLSTMQLSESIPAILRESLLGSGNPDPAHITSATLAPWSEPYYYDSGATDWSKRPDWDGNAYQLMLDAYNGVTGDYTLGTRTSHGAYQLASGTGLTLEFADSTTDWSLYPECSPESTDIWVSTTYESTVNLYELNATENTPVTPGPTPIPSPAPMCDTTVTRDLSAYYGVATLPGRTEYNLALSDHIPAALSQAIAASAPSQSVTGNISGWVGSGIDAETWYSATPEGIDAQANLRSQLENSGATVGDPIDRGTTTYTYANYRYLDITDLPDGCSPDLPDDQIQPAFSILIPVLQTTEVTVHYVEMNATLSEPGTTPSTIPTPTATTTPPSTPTPSGATQPASTPTTSPSGIQTLPNTGAGSAFTTRDTMLLATLLALFAALLLALVLHTRRT
jgi:hypothetical protein